MFGLWIPLIIVIFCSSFTISVSAWHQEQRQRRYPRSLPATTMTSVTSGQSPSLSSLKGASELDTGSLPESFSSLQHQANSQPSTKSKDGRGLSVLHSLTDYATGGGSTPALSSNSHHNHHSHHQHHSFSDSPSSSFDWTKNGHDVPVFVSEALNGPHSTRVTSLLDRAIVRAPWNVLTAKLFRIVAIFFLESYLVQLFGVSLPLD